MATVLDLKQKIDASYPGIINDITCVQPNAVSSWTAVSGTPQTTITAIQAIIDGFNWNTPAPDYSGFLTDVISNAAAITFPYAVLVAQMLADPSLTYATRKSLAAKCNVWLTALYPANATAIANFLITTANNHNMPIT